MNWSFQTSDFPGQNNGGIDRLNKIIRISASKALLHPYPDEQDPAGDFRPGLFLFCADRKRPRGGEMMGQAVTKKKPDFPKVGQRWTGMD